MAGYIEGQIQKVRQFVWPARRAEETPVVEQTVRTTAQILWVIVNDLIMGQASLRAMSLVYTTLLSLVPVLALVFAILKAFGVHDQVEVLLLEFLAPMGDQGREVTEQMLAFVEQVNISVLGSVGLIFLIYTLISLIQKIKGAFNDIWQVTSDQSFARQMASYVSVGLVGPLVLFLAIGVVATTLSSFLMETVGVFGPLRSVLEEVNRIAPYGFMILAFSFLYLVVPNTRVHIASALVGGTVAGVVWLTTGWAFTTFVVSSARYAAIYSAFASLILFMIWLYVAWLILLVGCSVSYYFQNRHHLSPEAGLVQLTPAQTRRLTLIILAIVHRSFDTGDTPWTIARLSQRLGIPTQSTQALVEPLIGGGYVAWTGRGGKLVPTRPAALTSLREVVQKVEQAHRQGAPNDAVLGADDAVDRLLADAEAASAALLEGKTLADLLKTNEGAA